MASPPLVGGGVSGGVLGLGRSAVAGVEPDAFGGGPGGEELVQADGVGEQSHGDAAGAHARGTAQIRVCPGDSGGTVYSHFGAGASVIGVVTAGTSLPGECGNDLYFTPLGPGSPAFPELRTAHPSLILQIEAATVAVAARDRIWSGTQALTRSTGDSSKGHTHQRVARWPTLRAPRDFSAGSIE